MSESEWEYVARAGTETRYTGGDARLAATERTALGAGAAGTGTGTAPVGSFSANAFGLHDVHGNVWEWVEDCWHGDYVGAPTDGSARTSGGDCSSRVLRGGSWFSNPGFVRSAYRFRFATGRPRLLSRFPSCQDVELSPESLLPCLLPGSRGRLPPGGNCSGAPNRHADSFRALGTP